MSNHALLSASSSHRWLNCPPSARLGENYEDKGSDFAAEGTDAHSLCEHKLKTALGIPSEDPTENLTWYNEEMEECASGYAAYVCPNCGQSFTAYGNSHRKYCSHECYVTARFKGGEARD